MIPRSNVVSPICPENGVRSAAFGPSRSSRSRPSTSVNKLLIELHGIFRQAQMVWRENWVGDDDLVSRTSSTCTWTARHSGAVSRLGSTVGARQAPVWSRRERCLQPRRSLTPTCMTRPCSTALSCGELVGSIGWCR